MLRSFLFLALITPCFADDSASAPAKTPVIDIVYIGDSITYGAGLPKPAIHAPPAISNGEIEAKLKGVTVFSSSQGHPGHTTVDFLPASHADFDAAEKAARDLQVQHPGKLVFSIMLGTNDSAVQGPHGAPVSPEQYQKNLTTIIEQLLTDFPGAKVFLQRPTWYSPNTHNGSTYDQAGLDRLNSYTPVLQAVIDSEKSVHPGQVMLGDIKGYGYFEQNHLTELQAENGREGTFYLHPNVKGAESLGKFWGDAIAAGLMLTP